MSRMLFNPPHGQGSWEIVTQMCQQGPRRKCSKDHKYAINICNTIETENLEDYVQTARKVWEIG